MLQCRCDIASEGREQEHHPPSPLPTTHVEESDKSKTETTQCSKKSAKDKEGPSPSDKHVYQCASLRHAQWPHNATHNATHNGQFQTMTARDLAQ
eukprot:5637193-Amphidinium_carterae.2